MAPESESDLLPEATRYLDYFAALTEVGKALASNLELAGLLEVVMQSVTQLMQPKNWSLLLVDAERQELYFEIVVGPAAEALRGMRLKLDEGIAGWVVQNGQPVVCPKVADDPRFSSRMDSATDFQTSSIVCVPLVCRGEVLGVIELVKDQHDAEPYDEEAVKILQPFADFTAIAIDNARSFQRVEELTVRDEWTGLYNSRFLHRCLEEEIARADRYETPVSLVFLDLDRFKTINDTHGHAVGSGVLRAVGERLGELSRKPDQAVRYGGDEFVIVLPATTKPGALVFAERVRTELARRAFVDADPEFRLSASVGVATYPQDANGGQTLLEAADRAMYEAKDRGRDQVVDVAELPARTAATA